MAYKDRDRQRQAVRAATRRYRERLRQATDGITHRSSHVIPVIPTQATVVMPYTGELTKAKQVRDKGFSETRG